MRQLIEPLDCPECGAAGGVEGDFCQVCYADVDPWRATRPQTGIEPPGEAVRASADRSPADTGQDASALLHPSVSPRFTHLIEELREIASEAMESGTTTGWRMASACRRAESLLFLLRRHFIRDVILGDEPPSAASP
jgi:hypothetical protein